MSKEELDLQTASGLLEMVKSTEGMKKFKVGKMTVTAWKNSCNTVLDSIDELDGKYVVCEFLNNTKDGVTYHNAVTVTGSEAPQSKSGGGNGEDMSKEEWRHKDALDKCTRIVNTIISTTGALDEGLAERAWVCVQRMAAGLPGVQQTPEKQAAPKEEDEKTAGDPLIFDEDGQPVSRAQALTKLTRYIKNYYQNEDERNVFLGDAVQYGNLKDCPDDAVAALYEKMRKEQTTTVDDLPF